MRFFAVLAVCLCGAFLLVWSSTSSARVPQQQPAGVEQFLECVDVDGDGFHTPGDRAVMEWWLSHGGSSQAVMEAAPATPGGGIRNATAFLASPAAQLVQ